MALIDPEAIAVTPQPLPLRVLDEDRQRLLGQLLPALDGTTLELATGEQLTVKARAIPASDAAAGAWLTGPAPQPALRFLQWDGEPVILHPERIADIAAMLTRADPLLSALELQLGCPVEPDQMGGQAPGSHEIVAVDFHGSHGLRHQFLLGFPPDFRLPVTMSGNDFNMTTAPVATSLECVIASLDVDDASTIAPGDLLVARGGSWPATLMTPFGGVPGQLDPQANRFSIGNGDPLQGQNMMNDEQEGDGGFGALKVPVSIQLPDQALTIEELGRLRAGLAVPVGPIAAGLTVEMKVAGRTIAIGELVRLGEQFAVHIDRLPQEAAPQSPVSHGIAMPDESDGNAGEQYRYDGE